MFKGNVKMAVAAVTGSKWRSLLTVLGIIIGVMSVITTVSLGEGIKQQMAGQIKRLGGDVITVKPGKIVERDREGRIVKVNIVNGYNFNSGSLPDSDLSSIQKTDSIKLSAPISLVAGSAKVDSREYRGQVIGTSADLPEILKQKVLYGAFFNETEANLPLAIIGSKVAIELFEENVPLGRVVSIYGQDFIVRGVFDEFEASTIALGPDLNSAIFIPYEMAQKITGGNTQVVQILAKPANPAQVDQAITLLNQQLLNNHGGQQDFTVLRQEENLIVTRDILNTMTGFIAGIAAISLLVGGIGIMNIMLVSVTERTREIGLRKAIGATNKQILGQFLIECLVLSCAGAILGLIASAITVAVIRITTDLQPVVTLPIVIIACLVSVAVGVLFGLAPAIKAASKDPIDALRYE